MKRDVYVENRREKFNERKKKTVTSKMKLIRDQRKCISISLLSSITDTTNSSSLIGDRKVNSVASAPARKQEWRVVAVFLSTWHLPAPLSTSLIRKVLTNQDHFPKLIEPRRAWNNLASWRAALRSRQINYFN